MRKVAIKIKQPSVSLRKGWEWSAEFIQPGLFHKWGNAFEEFESGPGNYTVAIVELPDGTIEEVLPSNVKFIKEEFIPSGPGIPMDTNINSL